MRPAEFMVGLAALDPPYIASPRRQLMRPAEFMVGLAALDPPYIEN